MSHTLHMPLVCLCLVVVHKNIGEHLAPTSLLHSYFIPVVNFTERSFRFSNGWAPLPYWIIGGTSSVLEKRETGWKAELCEARREKDNG